jgi:hypothetical protein
MYIRSACEIHLLAVQEAHTPRKQQRTLSILFQQEQSVNSFQGRTIRYLTAAFANMYWK